MKVTFFGHADTPEYIRSKLKSTIINLIDKKMQTHFMWDIKEILTGW